MKRDWSWLARALSLGLGLALLAAVLYWQRNAWDGVAAAFERIGIVGIAAVSAFHVLPLGFDAIAWRVAIEPRDRVGYLTCSVARWIGESFSSVLPAAQIGGELARARALTLFGVPFVKSGASVIVDMTVGIVSQTVYVIVGVVAFAMLAAESSGASGLQLALGIAVFALIAAVMVLAQVSQPFGRLLRRLGDRLGQGLGARLLGHAAAVEDTVMRSYGRRRDMLAAFIWRIVGWFAGAAEFWLAMRLMGSPITVLEAIMLESAVQAVRSLAFMIPGGFGVQEAALVALGGSIGMTADIAIALSLVKRAREYILGGGGLLAWFLLERRRGAIKA